MEGTMIAVDLAKNVIQTHGASMTGHRLYSRKLTRPLFRKFMAEQPPSVVVMEACGSAHYCRLLQLRLCPLPSKPYRVTGTKLPASAGFPSPLYLARKG